MNTRNSILIVLSVLFAAITAMSQTNQPFLRLNTEMHTSMIRRVSADAKGTINWSLKCDCRNHYLCPTIVI